MSLSALIMQLFRLLLSYLQLFSLKATSGKKKKNPVILNALKNPLGWVQGCPQAFSRRSESLAVDQSHGCGFFAALRMTVFSLPATD